MGDTTTNRAYRKPLSTDDPVNLTSFWRNLADDVDADVDLVTVPVSDTSIGSNSSGFTASSQIARTLCDGAIVYINLTTSNTSDVTASGSPLDITETFIFTLDAAYRPSDTVMFSWTTGSRGGTGLISSAGVVSLETSNGTINAGSTIRISAIYILAAS